MVARAANDGGGGCGGEVFDWIVLVSRMQNNRERERGKRYRRDLRRRDRDRSRRRGIGSGLLALERVVEALGRLDLGCGIGRDRVEVCLLGRGQSSLLGVLAPG